jgi:uncharacterized membrane protein
MSNVPPPNLPPPGPPPVSGGTPDIGAALSYGFNKYFANVGPVLAVVLIPIAVQIALGLIGGFVFDSIVGQLLLNVLSWIVSAVAALGIYQTALMITRGERPDVAKAFTTDRWGEWFLFSIVWGLIIGIGFVLCIIPGIVALAFLGTAPYYFLDQRLSLGDSLSAAWETGRRGYALPTIIAIIVGVLGVILCGIGVFVTAPAAYIAVGYLYRHANQQPIAQ